MPSKRDKTGRDILALQRLSREIRGAISELFDAPQPERIVLAPGILNALQILFASMDVRRVMLSTKEYYGAAHFPAQRVAQVKVEEIAAGINEFRPDVLILSVVSWKGDALPVSRIFSEIRKGRGLQCRPLLVADYSHAGALGFPSAKNLGADVLCGDLAKWVMPPPDCGKLAFLWFKSRRLFVTAKTAFKPFFLATDTPGTPFAARWVDPSEIRRVHDWFKRERLSRSKLLAKDCANKELALRLASLFGISGSVESNILWLGRGRMNQKHVRGLERAGLVWKTPDGKIRIVCRADAGVSIPAAVQTTSQ